MKFSNALLSHDTTHGAKYQGQCKTSKSEWVRNDFGPVHIDTSLTMTEGAESLLKYIRLMFFGPFERDTNRRFTEHRTLDLRDVTSESQSH